MKTPYDTEYRKAARTAAGYNMIPSLVWSALFLIPATIFCAYFITVKATLLLLGISLIPAFLPNSFFDLIQFSSSTYWYRRLGVKWINKVTQNGSLIKATLQKKYPGYKIVFRSEASMRKQYNQTYFFEKFHFCLFIFFTLITVYAVIRASYWWAFMLTISNIVYNIYPNLLQQYVRAKLRSGIKAKVPL